MQSSQFWHDAVASLVSPVFPKEFVQELPWDAVSGEFYFTLHVALLETDGNACEGPEHKDFHFQESCFYTEQVNSSGHVYTAHFNYIKTL